MHLAGAVMPLFPSLAIGATGSAVPAGEHLADLAVKRTEPALEIGCRAGQCLRNPLRGLRVSPQISGISHGGKRNHLPGPAQFTPASETRDP